jgi:hypothetical protein
MTLDEFKSQCHAKMRSMNLDPNDFKQVQRFTKQLLTYDGDDQEMIALKDFTRPA